MAARQTGVARLDEIEQRLVMGFRGLSPEWQQTILDILTTANNAAPPPPNIIPFPIRLR